MNLVFLIGLVLLALLAVVLLIQAAITVSRGKFANCPHCNCHGEIRGFGKFSCSICAKTFVMDGSGKPRSSVGKMVFVYGTILTVIAAVGLYGELANKPISPAFYLALISAIMTLILEIGLVVYPKKFPSD